MKSRLLIIIPIVVVIIAAIALIGNTSDIGIGQKYQYKFWVQEIKLEGDNLVTRVFFSNSNDYGKTFSEPLDMSMTEDYAHEPKMIVMDDDVILVWRDEVEDDTIPNLSFAKSTDFGETFEKKRLLQGARPDIVHYDDILYLTWVDVENRRVLYSTSDDRGETFVEPTVIFAPKGEFSPYADKPTPKFAIDDGAVKISWSMLGEDYEYVIGEDQPEIDSFEGCAAAGNPVMESYPRQCNTPDGKHFVEEIDLQIPNDPITSENINQRLEMTKKFLDTNTFGQATILQTDIDYTSKRVVVTISSEEFSADMTAEYYEEKLKELIPFETRILVARGFAEPELKTEQLGNFTLIVSNQSFDIDPVDITVEIDGKVVIDKDFDVENQHNYEYFEFQLSEGKHTIQARSEFGNAEMQEEFDVDEEKWAVLSFWYYEDEDDAPYFIFEVSDSPFGFA